MNTTTNTSCHKTSNMEELIACSLRYLDTDLETNDKDITYVSHPFFSCRFLPSRRGTYKDLVGNPKDLWAAKANLRKRIRKCTSPVEVFRLFSKSYLFFSLFLFAPFISVDDMSAVFRYVWQTGEYAAESSSVPKKDLLRMLRRCNPRILMDEDERMVYAVLPDELTLYRGVNPHNKQLIKSPSWTLNPANVRAYYSSDDRPFDSCNGKAYTARIQKRDVFAYFQHNTQVIVHPDKLYRCQPYWP